MDSTNEHSSNSLMNHGAANGISNDGTGKLQCSRERQTADCSRCCDPRPMACPIQRVPQSTIQQGARLDQDNQRDRRRIGKVQQSSSTSCHPIPITDQIREPRSLDSTWTTRTILPIGNGRLMLRKHSLLVNSVFLTVADCFDS
jgi:hypothetical protein